MTIGEKLLELHPYKHDDGVFEFKYNVRNDNGTITRKSFKGRLDNKFVAAEDGKNWQDEHYKRKPANSMKIGICRETPLCDVVNFSALIDLRMEHERWIYESILTKIAVEGVKMIRPIVIHTNNVMWPNDQAHGKLHTYGYVYVRQQNVRKDIFNLKYTKE